MSVRVQLRVHVPVGVLWWCEYVAVVVVFGGGATVIVQAENAEQHLQ